MLRPAAYDLATVVVLAGSIDVFCGGIDDEITMGAYPNYST